MFTHSKERQTAFRTCLKITLGVAILSFGLYNVHEQSGVTEGGLLGLTLLIHHWTPITPAISSLVLNVASYLLGLKFLGVDFLKKSVAAAVLYSAFYALWEAFPPLLPVMNPLIAAFVGAIFVGVGIGLAVTAGAAPGGDDAIAMVLSELFAKPIHRMYLILDLSVLALSLSYIPVYNVACSLVTVTISSYLIGLFTTPAKKGKKNKSLFTKKDTFVA